VRIWWANAIGDQRHDDEAGERVTILPKGSESKYFQALEYYDHIEKTQDFGKTQQT
jgi:hypothetical protein